MITQELFEKICATVATCSDGVNIICKSFGVSQHDFYTIKSASPENLEKYARAKESQVEPLLNQITVLQDEMFAAIHNEEDPRKCNAIQSAYREKIRHIEWVIAKLLPKKYGDKIDINADIKGDLLVSTVIDAARKRMQEQIEIDK